MNIPLAYASPCWDIPTSAAHTPPTSRAKFRRTAAIGCATRGPPSNDVTRYVFVCAKLMPQVTLAAGGCNGRRRALWERGEGRRAAEEGPIERESRGNERRGTGASDRMTSASGLEKSPSPSNSLTTTQRRHEPKVQQHPHNRSHGGVPITRMPWSRPLSRGLLV